MAYIMGSMGPEETTKIVCTPWSPSTISVGCDFGTVKVRVAEHLVGGPNWFITEFTVSSSDAQRFDLPERTNIDRRSITRVEGTAPLGFMVWF